MQFSFDNHTLDTVRRELLRDGALIAVQPQVFDLLVYLASTVARTGRSRSTVEPNGR